MSRPFGRPEKSRLVTLDDWRAPREEPEPQADAVSGVEVPPDDISCGLAWAGAGPEVPA